MFAGSLISFFSLIVLFFNATSIRKRKTFFFMRFLFYVLILFSIFLYVFLRIFLRKRILNYNGFWIRPFVRTSFDFSKMVSRVSFRISKFCRLAKWEEKQKTMRNVFRTCGEEKSPRGRRARIWLLSSFIFLGPTSIKEKKTGKTNKRKLWCHF